MRLWTAAMFVCWMAVLPVRGQNCDNTSVGFVPLSDLGTGTYQGFEGGLYPGGSNVPPPQHAQDGLAIAEHIVPLDAAGQPDANGVILMISIGMSNTRQEFEEFVPLAMGNPQRHPNLAVVNTAQGGQDAVEIADPNSPYWDFVAERLALEGFTPLQVQVVWLKEAIARPGRRWPGETFPESAVRLRDLLEAIVHNIKDKFPNTALAYLSSRIYAGYATTDLNPEPYAYESGFAVKWLIEDQIAGLASLNYRPDRGPVEAPWLSWAAYLWADGLMARSDGLIWECADFSSDGTHPSPQGRRKVAALLMDFFSTDPTARPWFLNLESVPGDFDGDGDVDIADFAFFSACFGGSGNPCAADCCAADLDGDGDVDIADFSTFSANFSGSQ